MPRPVYDAEAGARNAIDRDIDGAPVLSVEAQLSLDLAYVVVLGAVPVDDGLRARIHAEWARLAPLRAVRDGRVGAVGGPAAMSGGPGLFGAVDALRAELARLDR